MKLEENSYKKQEKKLSMYYEP